MNECRSAIPAWVMPLYRIVETVKPGSDLFDVAIIDEASQSGPEALILPYLAKQLVVVGDDKQISPSYVGLNRAGVAQLRRTYLQDLPHPDAFGVDHSFFDLAEIQYEGRIRLHEHFRCMPEIIQFSNNLCYAAEPLTPLRQFAAGRLTPVVEAVRVGGGYIKGTGSKQINQPEAEALVAKIEELHADERYEGKTFGVLSLLGHGQHGLIERMLLERLGTKAIRDRQLVCGQPSAFQGDERDVMFLSLVSAAVEGQRIKTLSGESDKQRFNVAASRARDQMFLFHSAGIDDLGRNCLRRALLSYCLNPRVEMSGDSGVDVERLRHQARTVARTINPSNAPNPFGSWFEVDVFLKIVGAGFRVLPQYEVNGYFIDLVVEGLQGRLAVECDGDHWHGPKQWDADTARQRDLERCGWRFKRLGESVFRLDEDSALEGLWAELKMLGIRTMAQEIDIPEGGEESEPAESLHTPAETRSPPSRVGPVETRLPAGSRADAPAAHLRGLSDGESLSPAEEDARSSPRSPLLPDPTETAPSGLVDGLLALIEEEGPIEETALFQRFVKAAGRHRVRAARQPLENAVEIALLRGLIEVSAERSERNSEERVLRKSGTPLVRVRLLGSRRLLEVPPSELRAVMQDLHEKQPWLAGENLYRALLTFYGAKKLTTGIRERLSFVESGLSEL